MKETKNYKLKLPEQADNIDIDVLDENFTKLDSELAKTDKNASDHAGDKNNPHEVSKKQLGLDKVENKSSADIRNEITKKNVTDALGFTPPSTNTTYGAASQSAAGLMTAADKKKLDEIEAGAQPHKAPTSGEVTNALGFTPARLGHTHNISDISNLSTRLSKIESRLTLLEGKALSVESWDDIASVSVTTSNTGDIDECYNFISGSLTTTWGQTISVRTVTDMYGASWGHEEQSTRSAYLDYNGNLYLKYHDSDEHGNDISHPSGTIYVGLAGMGKTETYTRNAPITSDFDD